MRTVQGRVHVGEDLVVVEGGEVGHDRRHVAVGDPSAPAAMEEVGRDRVIAGIGVSTRHVLDVFVDAVGPSSFADYRNPGGDGLIRRPRLGSLA